MRANIETTHLSLRWLDAGDADFIYRLLNDADWLRFIGDKDVANLEQARTYIENGPCAMYRQHGFGLNRVALRGDDTPIGICGLLQRETLQYSDLGFALLPEFRRKGYAQEAAQVVLQDGFTHFDMARIAAILNPANLASASLLEKLGFHLHEQIQMEPRQSFVDLYVIDRGT
ncbi:MAG: GNAT family N-acetyltransferase [Gammaproteobacteria bacterium]|nr:GNAT family N-acetyltransferase [Gammaproteobacteria bacterium]